MEANPEHVDGTERKADQEKGQNEREENEMAKAIVLGCVCVVISSLTPEDVDRYKAYDPEALILRNGTGEETFRLAIDDGPGSLMNSCALLSRVTNAEGKATITILLDPKAEDHAALVQENLGIALIRLRELEMRLLEKKDELQEKENQVKSVITCI